MIFFNFEYNLLCDKNDGYKLMMAKYPFGIFIWEQLQFVKKYLKIYNMNTI